MSQCEDVGVTYEGRDDVNLRCVEDATMELTCLDGSLKQVCPWHLKAGNMEPTAWSKRREAVMGLPMPGFEAMKALVSEIGL